jgi:hypothetical protein
VPSYFVYRERRKEIMKKNFMKLAAVFFVAMLTLNAMAITVPQVFADTTAISIVPSLLEFGPAACVGEEFIVECIVSDVTGLYGIDVKFEWNTTYLLYLNHTAKIPVEDFTDGIIHEPGMFVKDDVNAGAGTYWLAYASMSPAPAFDGTGIAFEMAFRIVKQPMGVEPDVTLSLHFQSTDLPDIGGIPITHDVNDGTVIIHRKPFEYPPEPMLKVLPETVTASAVGEQFESSVYLMGADGNHLDPFWDVAGFDVYMNFKRDVPPIMLVEAVDVTIDPDGWFAGFWPGGVFEVEKTIDNVQGWVHVVFLGMPGGGGAHTTVSGTGRLFNVTFEAIYESETYPGPCVDITLENPKSFIQTQTMHADAGIIDLASPVGTDWHVIDPYEFGTPFHLDQWVDEDGDGELSSGDWLNMTDTSSSFWYAYEVFELKGTLELEQLPFPTAEDLLCMDGPTHGASPWPKIIDTGTYTDGIGNYDWTGTFSCAYPVDSVNYFEVQPQIGAPYNLTEGVDFVVNLDGTIDLLTPLDEYVINEFVGTMPAVDLGWPALVNIASGIQGVYLYMPNGTQRYARNNGYAMAPPAEYWYDFDYPYEIESWWASGYFAGPWVWPDGTDIYCNYTAAAFVHIDYNAFADPRPYYVEFDGTYADFLALGDPVGTDWDEIYPSVLGTWNVYDWTDSDTSGDITAGDYLMMTGTVGNRTYLVTGKSTDIIVDKIATICYEDPIHDYYGFEPTVKVAGFPRPDLAYCPWHNSDSAPGLPHFVENGEFCAPVKLLGPVIDVFTQWPDPFGGQGPNQPSDMITPQCGLYLYAYVTYNDWPEQNKDVAFEVKDPSMTVWGIFYARTNSNGYAEVFVRMPWPCDDPDQYIGEWHVYASVDVACVCINDTLNFKYDYLVNIWKVTTDKDSYKHCEDIEITIDYGSYAMQDHNIIITVTVVDETGVPFGWTYMNVTIGGAEYCTYNNGTIILDVHVEKFARAGVATIYVGALSGFPQDGGCAITPLYTPAPNVGIEAEWAI